MYKNNFTRNKNEPDIINPTYSKWKQRLATIYKFITTRYKQLKWQVSQIYLTIKTQFEREPLKEKQNKKSGEGS